jgi:ribosome-associated protein
MDIKKLQTLVIDALEDIKAQDIKLFDTSHLTAMFDRIAVASGTSNRQTKALAASVRDKVKENGGTVISMEGQDTGEWVLVDLGDMVVHIMQPAIREYYRLEEIWGEKEVKFGAAKRTSKRTADGDGPAEEEPPKKRGRHLTVSGQTTAEPEPKKPAKRSTRAASAESESGAEKKPARKAAAPKTAAGGRVKVAAPKSAASAPRKAAAAPRKAPAKRAAPKTKSAD